jgi:hypothetical protein
MAQSAKAERKAASAGNLAVEYRAIGDLIPYARNARTHSAAQVALIAGSIREYGFTNLCWWMAKAASSQGMAG